MIPVNVENQTATSVLDLDLLYSNNATGITTANVNLIFDHTLTYVSFYVEAGTGLTATELESMTVTMTNVSTTAMFNLAQDTMQSLGPKTQSLPIPGKYYPTNQAAVFEGLIIPGCNGANTLINFTLTDGKVFTYAIPATQSYLPGYIYLYQVNLTSTAAAITASINPWKLGTLPNGGNIVVE